MLHLTVNALYAPHFTLRSPHFTPTLYTWHSTLYVFIWHSRFNLYAFALYTLPFMFDPHNFAIFTLDTVWNLGLAPLSYCVRTSIVVLNFRRSLRYFFPRFQRSTPVPTVDLWIFPYTVHSALRILHSTLYTLNLHATLYTPHSTLDSLHLTLNVLYTPQLTL